MTDPSRNAVTARPLRLRVQRFSRPRELIHRAVWCAGGLALIAAILCLVFAAFDRAAALLAFLLLLVAAAPPARARGPLREARRERPRRAAT